MAVSDLRDQILANAAEVMCQINPDNAQYVREYKLIVRSCGRGDKAGYKATVIDIAVTRIEGSKGRTLHQALEKLFDFTAAQLKDYAKDLADMGWSHIKDEELRKFEGGAKIAMKKTTPKNIAQTKHD